MGCAPNPMREAPRRPPIKAWLLEVGRLQRHMRTFHPTAPKSAQKRTPKILSGGAPAGKASRRVPKVLATAWPKTKRPQASQEATRKSAGMGFNARVAITVEMIP